jgi:RNA polymerase sigma-70 factor (ECF subfamily)
MDERPEDRLVEEARKGGREAFAELVRRHERRVYGVVQRMVGDRSDADDLAQEVFMTAWRSIGSFRSGSSFYTWLYRIAVNASLSFLRKKVREKGRAPFDENMNVADRAPGGPSSPERSSSASEIRGRAEEALRALPGPFRASFVLVEGEGLSHREAARVLGCSENTVSWRMHKARKLLRARLKPWLEEVRS